MNRIGKVGMMATAGLASAAALLWRRSRGGGGPATVATSVTVARSREAVWSFWRRGDDLPRLVAPIRIEPIGDDRRRWRIPTPDGGGPEGILEVVEEREHELLALRSPAGSDPEVRFEIRLDDAPAGSTAVHATMEWSGGAAAEALEALEGAPRRMMTEVLRRHKRLLETDQIPTTEGQPAGADRERP